MKYLQRIKAFLKKTPKIFKKNISEIVERRNFRDIIYTYNIETNELNKTNMVLPYETWNGRELKFKKENEDLIIVRNLHKVSNSKPMYDETNQRKCLDINLFIKDIIDICDRRQLSLISIFFDREMNGKVTGEFFTIEKDMKDGETLPKDIRMSYRSYIKSAIKRKGVEYREVYGITDEEFYTFYDTSPQLLKMREKGVFSIKTVISL